MNLFTRLYFVLCFCAFPSVVFSLDNNEQRHTSPIPNLIDSYVAQNHDASAPLKAQQSALNDLHNSILKEEREILDAALDNEPLDLLDEMGQLLMQSRLQLIKQGVESYALLKQTLSSDEFENLRASIDNSSNQALLDDSHLQLLHSNPLPNLVEFVLLNDSSPALTGPQRERLKKWQSELAPTFLERSQTIVIKEAELLELVLKGQSLEAIDTLSDDIAQLRVRMIRGKSFSRERVKQILDNEQYQKLLGKYPTR